MKILSLSDMKQTLCCNAGEKGHTLLSTPTTVLFCNLVLKPGDSKSGK